MQKFTRIAALLLVVVAVALAITALRIGRRAAMPASTVAALPATAAQDSGTRQATVSVVLAAAPLAAGVPITAASLSVTNWPQRPAGGYADVDAVAGSIPVLDIPAGAPITASVLSHGVAMALKPGERAMAVPVDEQVGAGNRVLPGDYVDVFLSLKTPQAATYGKAPVDGTQTRLLLSRLRVLAYGNQDLPQRPQQGSAANVANSAAAGQKNGSDSRQVVRGSTDESQQSQQVPRTAVLAVPVQEADQLLLGVQNGKLSLAVRRPNDDGRPDHGLFPAPRTVLAARTGLTADQRQLLESPENRAYAGINGQGLAGHDDASPKPVASPRAVVPHDIEVIRGTADDSSRASQGRSL